MKELQIESEFVTLGQILKMTDAISSGGMAKWYLSENVVYVNGEPEDRRGRKIRHGDTVVIPAAGRYQIVEINRGDSDVH